MTPQKRGLIPDPERARIVAALAAREAAEAELRAAVVAGLLAGGSVREVAALTGMSTNTIQRWGREGGWPSAEQKAERSAKRAENDAWQARLDAANRMLRLVDPEQSPPQQ
ncbi:hypothetical protein GS907_24610 [Rhodococcus hoagii]|uniref:helix-turn-helix domain-containing protein n=1 Tax=Rhodococcus hoagii TaxID=43767 RepID=UPI001131878F|nr:helix-turn-helix domain-containing protein [Prescottella equi]NKR61714.1 hypothetical protein [Prescottella equi]NKU21746.1 hypothetical protein [Prescottella equi]